MMAKRAKAKTVEVNASHVAYMSHPKEAAKLIEEAAVSVVSNSNHALSDKVEPAPILSGSAQILSGYSRLRRAQ